MLLELALIEIRQENFEAAREIFVMAAGLDDESQYLPLLKTWSDMEKSLDNAEMVAEAEKRIARLKGGRVVS